MRAALLLLATVACAAPTAGVEVSRHGDAVRVSLDGEPFTVVHLAGERQPYLCPVLASGAIPVTRAHPIEARAGEPADHPHHLSLWLAHGRVNGRDFWHGEDGRCRIVCEEALPFVGAAGETGLLLRLAWSADGTRLCDEERRLVFGVDECGRFIDVTSTLVASVEDLVLGDTKEGTFALRLHPALALVGAGATGRARNSSGHVGAAVWGKRAAWVDFAGRVDGVAVGVAIVEHPANLRAPTYWHARDYGLVAANPFGVHDFVGAAEGTGDLRLVRGERLTLRWRVIVHGGELEPEDLDRFWSSSAFRAG